MKEITHEGYPWSGCIKLLHKLLLKKKKKKKHSPLKQHRTPTAFSGTLSSVFSSTVKSRSKLGRLPQQLFRFGFDHRKYGLARARTSVAASKKFPPSPRPPVSSDNVSVTSPSSNQNNSKNYSKGPSTVHYTMINLYTTVRGQYVV